MVKDSKKKAAKTGPNAREERIALRAHADLIEILDRRAEEKGQTRSAYIESLLIAWVKADPRNPRIDNRGKLVPDAPTPAELQRANPQRYTDRWVQFNRAFNALFGTDVPREWREEWQEHWQTESE
ncbi:hypothetical protein [Bradyrhizobium betae]|uniref:Uncharacterized protein n=1 Tax=Bradyrhizobium betae TaxID=244734 RepID=A0A5P6P8W8_9BRAD|nr:hypothetical protein [Bradyrhizobium betae]MCS3727364.1 hypothetical protein [Bradyrhizobium betae]QFI74742.1 hypothetical protein F8237_21425 [Bradyrhizobium betae]